MDDRPKENSLQTAARWGRNAAIGAVAAGTAISLIGSIAEPILRKRQQFRRNRRHGTKPVDRKTSKANIEQLKCRVAEFKDRLAKGENLLDLWLEEQEADLFTPAQLRARLETGADNRVSIESLLDKSRVPTMNPARYHEIEKWWDEIYVQGTALEEKWLREDEADADDDAKAREQGVWSERSPKWVRLLIRR